MGLRSLPLPLPTRARLVRRAGMERAGCWLGSVAVALAALASPIASAGLLPGSRRPALPSPVLGGLAKPVRHELTLSAQGFERRWAQQVRGLLEARFDVDTLPLDAPLTVWTANGDIIAFEVPTPDGARAFATRESQAQESRPPGGEPGDEPSDESSDESSARWMFADGSTLDGPVLARPLRYQSVSSKLGPREHPVHRFRKFHAGTDYAAPVGTPVHAIADGKVLFAGHALTAGNFVIIEHDVPVLDVPGFDGLETRSMHLHRIARGIVTGARVRKGDIIGEVGQTGMATGPHLHFEVRDGWGTLLDPTDATWPSFQHRHSPEVTRAIAIRRALLATYEVGGGRDLFARILARADHVDEAPEDRQLLGAFAIPFSPPRSPDRRARVVELPSRRRRRGASGRDLLVAA